MTENRPRANLSKIKKILAIRNDKIGDLILSSNVITLLRRQFPTAKIDIVVSEENKPLIEENKSINKIYVLKYSPRTIKEFLNYFNLSKKIRAERYDIGVDLRGSFFNIFFLLFLGGVKYNIGFYTNKLSKLFLDYAHLKDFKGHASNNMVEMMNEGLRINSKNLWPEIAVSKHDIKEIKKFIKENKISKSISLCVDSSHKLKQWPLDRFDEIIKYLHKNYPAYKILLLSIDKNKIYYLIKKNPFCIPLLNQNLRFIFLLFKMNKLVIAPDGGMMHLAWVSKTNLIAFIPPSIALEHFEQIKPLGKNAKIIFKELKNIKTDEIKNLIDKILIIKK